MIDHDHHFALLLQKQFEQEAVLFTNNKNDVEMANLLQKQFEQEVNVEQPGNGLVYDMKKRKRSSDSKCLIDPSWELIDPTPNIHTMFMAFNQRFFWEKLLTVCVSWSKRMTSCAGICSYQGRGGLCKITLSEPLLKLRPRKDLVETLLHEMIHAYLFLTHSRDNDRDGHGADFQKHMHRINGEAGTNITIYHDFHDEVRLYKQHWWRCNGPCQNKKPYFGMVRRAMNRAPGPYDRWWGEHSRTCGGNFIKVKEPEKKQKPQKENSSTKKATNTKSDIRNYISASTDSKTSNIHTINSINKIHGNESNNVSVPGNIHLNKTNIKGIKDFCNTKMTSTSGNLNNTIVINPKTLQKTNNNIKETISTLNQFSATAQKVRTSSDVSKINDYSVVRNHWLKRFNSDTSASVTVKEPSTSVDLSKNCNSPKECSETFGFVSCPVCQKRVLLNVLNEHLNNCLENDDVEACFNCDKKFKKLELDSHISKCLKLYFEDEQMFNSDLQVLKNDYAICISCDKKFIKSKINEHTSKCLESVFEDDIEFIYKTVKCIKCGQEINEDLIKVHAKSCEVFNNFNEHQNKEQKITENVLCLVCGKQILQNQLNEHLEECVVDIFDSDNFKPEIVDIKSDVKYNCPLCMDLYTVNEMNAHLDVCLRDGNDKNSFDRAIILDSFSRDVF